MTDEHRLTEQENDESLAQFDISSHKFPFEKVPDLPGDLLESCEPLVEEFIEYQRSVLREIPEKSEASTSDDDRTPEDVFSSDHSSISDYDATGDLPESESDDSEVKSDDSEVRSDDSEVRSDDSEVESDNPEYYRKTVSEREMREMIGKVGRLALPSNQRSKN